MEFKKFIARSRLRYSLGVGVVGMFTSAIGILTFAKVWENTFVYYGIPPVSIYIAMPIGFFVVCFCIGYIYDVKGIWKEETSHSNTKLNPEFVTICENVERMDKKLDDIAKQIEEINGRFKS
jgi:hypothetical protein